MTDRLASALFCCLWLVGCNKSPAPAANPIITSFGDFKSPDQKYNLHIKLGANRQVSYSIKDLASDQVVAGDTAGTDLQRWFFYWDENANLWVHSSDIGGCVWRNQNGIWTKRAFTEKDDLRAVTPKVYYDQLPESIKQR